MSKNPIDHDHLTEKDDRAPRYSHMDRIRAGQAGHPSIQMLTRRRRRGETDATLVKQYLRIERGYLA